MRRTGRTQTGQCRLPGTTGAHLGVPAGRLARLGLAVVFVAVAATASADTLVLRNGDRVQGRLLAVRDGVVEFEELRGNRPRVVRIDQDEIRAIEFDRYAFGAADRDPRVNGGTSTGQGPAGGAVVRPRGLRERDVEVPARTAWTDTGVEVRAGQIVYFSATGRVRWGPRRQDGPEGERDSPRNPGRPMPSRPAAALIGRVGEDAPFFIGADQEGIRVRGGGRLYLGVNDDVLDDNTGELRVTIYF
jgi:hypothetical protein